MEEAGISTTVERGQIRSSAKEMYPARLGVTVVLCGNDLSGYLFPDPS